VVAASDIAGVIWTGKINGVATVPPSELAFLNPGGAGQHTHPAGFPFKFITIWDIREANIGTTFAQSVFYTRIIEMFNDIHGNCWEASAKPAITGGSTWLLRCESRQFAHPAM